MKRRVLVVDDDASIRHFLELALCDSNYTVTLAEHGQAALEQIAQVAPDLILLDMRMPVMDGWAFAEAYRASPAPHAPVIVLTAARDAASYAREVGATAFLAKPFDLRELLALISRTLASKGTPKSARGRRKK